MEDSHPKDYMKPLQSPSLQATPPLECNCRPNKFPHRLATPAHLVRKYVVVRTSARATGVKEDNASFHEPESPGKLTSMSRRAIPIGQSVYASYEEIDEKEA